MEQVIVTRHKALVEYLVTRGIVGSDVPVIAHATPEDIKGRHVYGVLPLSLAKLAGAITEIPLHLPPELRGKELSLEQVKKYSKEPATYVVGEVKEIPSIIEGIDWYRFHNKGEIEDLIELGLRHSA